MSLARARTAKSGATRRLCRSFPVTNKPKCTRGPNGEFIETSVTPGPMGQHTVGIVKADGTFVYLSSDSTVDKSTSSAIQPALTTAQMTAIALDPAFSIKS